MDFLHLSDSSPASFRGGLRYKTKNAPQNDSYAVSVDDETELVLYIPRAIGACGAFVRIDRENGEPITGEMPLAWRGNELDLDEYDVSLPIAELGIGLFFLRVRIESAFGVLYAERITGEIVFAREETKNIQLTVSDFLYPEPRSFQGGILYHVFIDRFAMGGEVPLRKDAVLIEDWDAVPEYPAYPGAHLENNTFFGGTLYGLADRLDRLASLGVTILYLSPIFEAYSNHKYDTGDYEKIDAMFGGEDAFRLLLKKADALGIRVILDGVFNHTGSDSKYFNRSGRYPTVGAYQSKDSPYYGWYDFQEFPNRYTSWWNISILPRINPNIPKCGDYFTAENGIIGKYADMGIAGMRLDVADELSDSFLAGIRARLAKSPRDTILFGEVWEDASNKIAYDQRKKYYLGSELDAVMNYPIRVGILRYLKDRDPSALAYALTDVTENMPVRIRDLQMNLLGTHDTERVLTVLSGVDGTKMSNAQKAVFSLDPEAYALAKKRLFCAYTVLATLPGIPSIYYGDEAGVEGFSDPFNRRTYPWGHEDKEILAFYTAVGKRRRAEPLLECGGFSLIRLDENCLIFSRFSEKIALLTIVNLSDREMHLSLSSGKTLASWFGEKEKEIVVSPLCANVFRLSSDDVLLYDWEPL